MYTYKDIVTGKTKRTRGKFAGWSERTGPLHIRYAIFANPSSHICVPAYCLTDETRAAIPPIPRDEKEEAR